MIALRLPLAIAAWLAISCLNASQRPNIILFIADDLGMGDVRCYDETSNIPTPNLDRLAREGMRFTDVHSPAAVCTPTRFSVLTGRYPFRSDLKTTVLFSAYDTPLLKPEMQTLPEMLRDAGYATGGFGKWHLGCAFQNKANDGIAQAGVSTSHFTTADVDFSKPLIDGPVRHGFDYWFGLASSINHGPYSYLENDRISVFPDRIRPEIKTPGGIFRQGWIAPGWDDTRIGEGICVKALDWLSQQAATSQPFFMYYAEVAPHFPNVPPDDILGTPIKGQGGNDESALRSDMVLQVDTILGKLLERLEDPNGDGDRSDSIASNTLIIATSDNGADKGFYMPIRDKKGSIWEGGHRVPFIARWPDCIAENRVNVSLFGLNDLYATFATIAQGALDRAQAVDSHDMGAVFTGKTVKRPEPLVIHRRGTSKSFAVRDGPWKLIQQENESRELYNLERDLKETTDIAAQNPEIQNRLIRYLNTAISNYDQDGK